MASSVITEKKLCAAIYVLDESLKEHAIKLKKFFEKKPETEICNCLRDNKIFPDDEGSVAIAREHYLNCKEITDPIKSSHDQCKVDVYNFDDLSKTIDKVNCKSGDISHHEVIIIFGHCSALLAEKDDLVVALRKINPIIVAFLGCGGNTRYGPIVKMSQLLDPDDDTGTKPIIGFYQRRVYVSELLDTSLVIGLQYYMHIRNSPSQPAENKNYRKIAICAFGLSTSKHFEPIYRMGHTHMSFYYLFKIDPTSFVNDTSEDSFVHKCQKKCNLKIIDIPLSCMQFALCSPMIMDWSLLKKPAMDLSTLHAQIKESICKRLTELEQLVEKLNKKIDPKESIKIKLDELCKEKIRGYQFHKLIPLIYEINFIKLSNETLKLIKNGDSDSWEKIDHLQFLIAVLRGHWGKNSLAVIKDCATFHLMKVMNDLKLWLALKDMHEYENLLVYSTIASSLIDDIWHTGNLKVMLSNKLQPFSTKEIAKSDAMWDSKNYSVMVKDHIEWCLHRYKLCCMCYVLLCDYHFVRFVEPHEHQYNKFGILACAMPLTCTTEYSIKDITPETKGPEMSHLSKFPDDEELPWVNLYQRCRYISDCVELLDPNNNRESWSIGNRTALGNMRDRYEYNQTDFKLAAGALSDYVKINDIQAQIRAIMRAIMRNNARVPSDICRPISYYCKKFFNANVEDQFMECIDEARFQIEFTCTNDISFIESKVIYMRNRYDITDEQLRQCYQEEEATLHISQNELPAAFDRMYNNKRAVSSCRFVFAKFNNPAAADDTIQGILFYTDNHYGHNLIDFTHTNEEMFIGRCTGTRCQEIRQQPPDTPANYFSAIMTLCMPCKYLMQEEMIRQMNDRQRPIDFPFVKIGRLMLTYDNDHEHHLTNIALLALP